jgi:hypothetical protein
MADLTAAAPLRFHNLEQCHIRQWVLDTSAAQSVYRGQPIIIDQSEDTVYVRGFVTATVVATTDIFVGIALENKSVLIGATESTKIEVLMHGLVGFKSTVYTDADVGDTVYMSDSATLSATNSQNPMLGALAFVEDGYAYVMINPTGAPTICAGA